MSDILVEQVTAPSSEIEDAVRRLLPQLSSSAPPFTAQTLEMILGSTASRLLVARIEGRIVGMLTLVIFPLPSGIRAWIEDVVVDDTVRGKGVGEAIARAAIGVAESAGVRSIDLTSRPTRQGANRLYMRVGFVQRETNVYRYASGARAPGPAA